MYNVLDFGAKENVLATKSIQAAIDACSAEGGGRVIIPSGTYVCGTIWLKSNVELHLEMGAVLKASSDMDDYNDEDAYPQNYGVPVENWRGTHLIIALEAHNVAITGNGVNVLAMGAFYVAPAMGCDIADAYLNADLGTGYEWWKNFYEFHKLAIDELEEFDYEEYKKNGFKVNKLGDFPLKLETKPE